MVAYNTASIERRDGYAAQLHVDGRVILDVLRWCFESLPDEVLVGMDPHPDRHHRPEVESMFRGRDEEVGLFICQKESPDLFLWVNSSVLILRYRSIPINYGP